MTLDGEPALDLNPGRCFVSGGCAGLLL